MTIAVLGASGYIGINLIEQLLKLTEYTIVALSPNAEKIKIESPRLKKYNVDVFNTQQLAKYLKPCDKAYYLIHMMVQEDLDFAKAEKLAAESFCKAAKGSGINRVIYLGGLGNDEDILSKHLVSRHLTGEIIRRYLPQVIEFRASMIIGNGSVSYDIITSLVNSLPVIVLPKWSYTLTQPIGLKDALAYLMAALYIKTNRHEIIEIGGTEQLSYLSLMKRYSAWKRKRTVFLGLPIISFAFTTWWLNLFTSKKQAKVGRKMIGSLINPMVVTNNYAKQLFPSIKPQSLEDVFI